MVDSGEESGETLEPLRGARPAGDPVRMAEVRASAERALFRGEHKTRIGRFEVIDALGAGGMGVVHRAYDPELDRKVALKVIHPRFGDSASARERLMGEARALAQLKHPNVVPVHDVVLVEDQVVVVMELVEGAPLAAWEREASRTWRDVVSAYVAAGRGLEAAHALGIVHRDFKPANVLVGDDGRVRVLDFGLARIVPGAAAGDAAPASAGLTATGDAVGTVGYMAPEQLAGDAATAASDQFSFCVALYHALFGVRPFAGENAEQLLAAIRSGRIAPASRGRRVPRRLRRLVLRGLAAVPSERHASMRALLLELDREHGWRRWRTPAMVSTAALVAAGGVALAWLRAPAIDPVVACAADAAELDAMWGGSQREQIRSAFDAIGTPYARATVDRVLGGLDAYRASWAEAHRDACLARRGAQSTALSDRRAVCLQRRKDDLVAAAAVLARVDGSSAVRAMDVVAGLPALSRCADLDALAAESEPPATEAARAEVAALRQRLSRIAALERAGRGDDALAQATAATKDARSLGYLPAVVEAGLVEGRILLGRYDFKAAIPLLASIEAIALEQRQYAAATVAAARRLYAEGLSENDLPGLRRQIAVIEPLGRGLVGDAFALPLLLNNVGTVFMASSDRTSARRYFEAARHALDGVASPDLELAFIDVNLALVTPDAAERVALVRGAWERLRDRLGAEHPSTIRALYAYARLSPDPGESLRLVDEACALYQRFHPGERVAYIECIQFRASVTSELGDEAKTAARYEEILALTRGETDRDLVSWRLLAEGHLRLVRGDAAGAVSSFAAVIAEFKNDGLGDRLRAAHAHLGSGLAAQAMRNHAVAVAHFERAIPPLAEWSALNEDAEARFLLARARGALNLSRSSP